MPTISGLRRRGVPPERFALARRIGVTKSDSVVETQLLDHCIRELLNSDGGPPNGRPQSAKSRDNYPEGKSEELEAVNNPEDEGAGSHGAVLA